MSPDTRSFWSLSVLCLSVLCLSVSVFHNKYQWEKIWTSTQQGNFPLYTGVDIARHWLVLRPLEELRAPFEVSQRGGTTHWDSTMLTDFCYLNHIQMSSGTPMVTKKRSGKKLERVGMVTSLHSRVDGTNRRNQFSQSILQSLPQIPKYLTNQKWNGRRLSSNGLSGRFTGKRQGDRGGRRGRPKNTTLASTGRFDLPRLLRARLGRRLLWE